MKRKRNPNVNYFEKEEEPSPKKRKKYEIESDFKFDDSDSNGDIDDYELERFTVGKGGKIQSLNWERVGNGKSPGRVKTWREIVDYVFELNRGKYLTSKEVWDVVQMGQLYKGNGLTPQATCAAVLSVGARKNIYLSRKRNGRMKEYALEKYLETEKKKKKKKKRKRKRKKKKKQKKNVVVKSIKKKKEMEQIQGIRPRKPKGFYAPNEQDEEEILKSNPFSIQPRQQRPRRKKRKSTYNINRNTSSPLRIEPQFVRNTVPAPEESNRPPSVIVIGDEGEESEDGGGGGQLQLPTIRSTPGLVPVRQQSSANGNNNSSTTSTPGHAANKEEEYDSDKETDDWYANNFSRARVQKKMKKSNEEEMFRRRSSYPHAGGVVIHQTDMLAMARM